MKANSFDVEKKKLSIQMKHNHFIEYKSKDQQAVGVFSQ